jgi:hypothetical protein
MLLIIITNDKLCALCESVINLTYSEQLQFSHIFFLVLDKSGQPIKRSGLDSYGHLGDLDEEGSFYKKISSSSLTLRHYKLARCYLFFGIIS